MNKSFNSIVEKLNQDFKLINLNGRPVFIRPQTTDDWNECCRGCGKKKNTVRVYEIDKFEHYSDWEWCGKTNCDVG